MNTFRLLKYKDIRISYLEQAEDEMELRRLQSWSGIKDPQLLRVAFWCVEAHMFNENVTELQGELTSEVRKELGRMLRRIEHGIEPDVNCTLVKELCRRENISEKYLTSFIQSVTMSPKIIWGKLRECSHE